MAGFEVIVRPVVFPNIRPTPKRTLPPQDDPDQGIATIRGNPAQIVELPFSWSVSSSHSKPVETQRREDEARVYQQEDDGTVNRDNFIDIKVANKIWMKEPGAGPTLKEYYYAPIQEDTNIEVLNKDVITKAPEP